MRRSAARPRPARARKRTIVVNDKMQKDYRYVLSAPVDRNFDPEFKLELTPRQMLRLGVFCGKYTTDAQKEFPKTWFIVGADGHSRVAMNTPVAVIDKLNQAN